MPTYQYECQACQHHFEEFQSIKADPLVTCPKCHEKTLKRLIGMGGGVIFKGSGFYVNDYPSSSRGAPGNGSPPSCPQKDGKSCEAAGGGG